MKVLDQRRSLLRPGGRPLTAEDLAAIRAAALTWRARWREEVAARTHASPRVKSHPRPERDGAKQRAQFATGMARAEFGRFYWNGKLDGQLRAAMERRSRRKPER
jgi:hypothetical protein